MWANFYTKKTDLNFIMQSLEGWKQEIFKIQSQKVKEYFATKVVTYFDNMMIFHQKNGLHNNLMDSLGIAEKEMQQAKNIFKSITVYIIKEEKGYSILTHNLIVDSYVKSQGESFNFDFVNDNLGYIENLEDLKFNSFNTLIFDFDLVNFSKNWINYTPALEERSKLQAEFILYNMNFRKQEVSLLEKINFEENIKNHPQYDELLEKVMKIMPRIENSLEQEWRTKIITEKIEKRSISNVYTVTSKKSKK